MRILLINYRYFVSGGPERYMFDVKALLESHGHTVIPFSVAYTQNEPSEYQAYFAPPLAEPDKVYFREQSPSVKAFARTLERAFFSPVVYKRLGALIDATEPDVAFVLHYLRKLSPAVLKCLADKGVPSAVFMNDFVMVCPNAHLLRDAKPCGLCVTGSLLPSVRYRCVQGSAMASTVNYVATRFHQIAGYFDLVGVFVAPSSFTRQKMLEAGWSADRVVHIPMFVSGTGNGTCARHDPPIVAYTGRLHPSKGVETLLEAARRLAADIGFDAFSVRVAGTGEGPYVEQLHEFVRRHELRNVCFEGWRDRSGISALLQSARCAVVPSLWYEIGPLAVLESMAEGTPVIGSDHGSIAEQIQDGVTGLLVQPDDSGELAAALRRLVCEPDLAERLGQGAREFIHAERSPEQHYSMLADTLWSLQAPPTAATSR